MDGVSWVGHQRAAGRSSSVTSSVAIGEDEPLALHDLAITPEPGRELRQSLEQLCAEFGLDHAAYAGFNPVDNSIHGVVTYPDAWKLHYVEQAFETIDPTLAAAATSTSVIDWHRLKPTDDFQRVFRDAAEFGIGSTGLTIPVRGAYGDSGAFSVVRKCSEAEWKQQRAEIISGLQMRAANFHDRIMRQGRSMFFMRQPNLSAREKEVLQWVAAGKSQTDIGTILSISTRTVEVHLRSAREKLGALTTSHAVARAIGMEIIYPL